MKRLVFALAILLLPVPGFAQEATVTGTVVDQTGGVLPGVTVTAVHETTGNTFVAVTDERGIYRVPVRVGIYRMMMELPGFANVAERFEALGCVAGEVERRAGQRGDQVGDQHEHRELLRKLPQRPVQLARLRPAACASVLEPAFQRDIRRANQEGPRALLCLLRTRTRAV